MLILNLFDSNIKNNLFVYIIVNSGSRGLTLKKVYRNIYQHVSSLLLFF